MDLVRTKINFLFFDKNIMSKLSKLLTSSCTRKEKFIPVNNFSAQEHASSKKRHTLNFRVMASYERVGRKMYTYLSV